MNDEKKLSVDDAVAIIRRDYYEDVRGLAECVIEEQRDEFDAESGELTGDVCDAVADTVDGSQRVIYTWQAKLGLLVSENEDAWENVGVECMSVEQRMYFALQADIMEYLQDTDFVLEVLSREKK